MALPGFFVRRRLLLVESRARPRPADDEDARHSICSPALSDAPVPSAIQ
jgi:hypothetical protein